MRKHNRYLPPALKHNGRQNNSVVSRRKRKRPNAQKHGVFAEPLILPGEPLEFEAIHSALIEEWTSVWSKRAESRLRFCRCGVAQASVAQICAGQGDCQQLKPPLIPPSMKRAA